MNENEGVIWFKLGKNVLVRGVKKVGILGEVSNYATHTYGFKSAKKLKRRTLRNKHDLCRNIRELIKPGGCYGIPHGRANLGETFRD